MGRYGRTANNFGANVKPNKNAALLDMNFVKVCRNRDLRAKSIIVNIYQYQVSH